MKRFYVVAHIDSLYSIQTSPKGAGELLDVKGWDYSNKELAELLCEAANKALDSVGMLESLA